MNVGLTTRRALRTGAAAFGLSLLAGAAWASESCARPQDVAALQTAALQQQLMVAALTCHDVSAYNRFVISHRGELQKSDKALMSFFVRQDAHRGADDYNAYKTWLANDSSLRSLRDPQFCRGAKVTFGAAFERKMSLAELVSERPSLIKTGYASCSPGASEPTLVADAAPNLPTRHPALPDSLSSPERRYGPAQGGAVMALPRGNADSRIAGQLQARNTYEGEAYDRDTDSQDADSRDVDSRDADERDDTDDGATAPRYVPRYADARPQPRRAHGRDYDGYGDDNVGDNSSDGYGDGPDANDAPDSDAYDAPDTNRLPPGSRLVRARDGSWFVVPDGR